MITNKIDLNKFTKARLIKYIIFLEKFNDVVQDYAYILGKKQITEIDRKDALESIDEGYRGVSNVAIINSCNKYLEYLNKKINELDNKINKLKI